ncbi:protein of unknown function [Methylocaldum szegediense]|uniref:Uncharacterized protein n=2 Tax=Methylocaldum szegediense TaxID=73780 RepID=A0ABN8X8T8_9GAMM|nr:protein of unknown function [Methylocaldum szegediense]
MAHQTVYRVPIFNMEQRTSLTEYSRFEIVLYAQSLIEVAASDPPLQPSIGLGVYGRATKVSKRG